MSEAKKGKNHPLFGKNHTIEARAKMSEARGAVVEVLDKETNVTSTYVSISKAAEALG
jgi:hypothetical protein